MDPQPTLFHLECKDLIYIWDTLNVVSMYRRGEKKTLTVGLSASLREPNSSCASVRSVKTFAASIII